MLVSRVSSLTNSNIVPTQVNTKRTAFSNLSFGYLPSTRAQRLLEFLPHNMRKEIFSPMMEKAAAAENSKAATDAVWAQMLITAWRIRTKLHKAMPIPHRKEGSIAKSISVLPSGGLFRRAA